MIITAANIEAIRPTLPLDQAAELVVGCEIINPSNPTVTTWPNGRAAICSGGDSDWGDILGETSTICLDTVDEYGNGIYVDMWGDFEQYTMTDGATAFTLTA